MTTKDYQNDPLGILKEEPKPNDPLGILTPEPEVKKKDTWVSRIFSTKPYDGGVAGSSVGPSEKQPKGPQKIVALNDFISKTDDDILSTVQSYRPVTVEKGDAGGRAGGDTWRRGKFSNIDLNNPDQYGDLILQIKQADFLESQDGKVDRAKKQELLDKLTMRMMDIVSQKGVSPTLRQLNDPIEKIVLSKTMSSEQAGNKTNVSDDPQRINHFKLGLTLAEKTNPQLFNNVINGIAKLNNISDVDFSTIARMGQEIENLGKYKASAYDPAWEGTQTKFDYTTYGEKKAAIAGDLGEAAKKRGWKNQNRFTSKQIDTLAEDVRKSGKEVPQRVVDNLKREEKLWGYDAIPKSGWMDDVAAGIMQPVAGIESTINSLSETPAETYYRSKQLDAGLGGQKVPDEKGQYSDILPSERGDWKTDAFRGFGQFIPQVLLAKGFGGLTSKAIGTGANASIYIGTGMSTYLQTYGQEYEDALKKTGDPKLAKTIGAIDAAFTSAWEMILPDAKILDNSYRAVRNTLNKDLTSLIKTAQNPADLARKAAPYIARATKEIGKVWGREVSEEVGTNITDFVTESIASPKTAIDRDIAKELSHTIKTSAAATLFPAILGGGMSAIQKDFTQSTLHSFALNFEDTKSSLERSLANDEITPEQYDQTIGLLTSHQASLDSAPKKDANGNDISEKKQLEYAYNNTVEQVLNKRINEEIERTNDPVQVEHLQDKVKDAQEAKRKIFKEPDIAEVDDEEIQAISPEPIASQPKQSEFNDNESAAIEGFKGKDFPASVKTWTDIIQDEAQPAETKKQALRELYEQLTATGTEVTVGEALGKQADLIYNLGYEQPQESEELQQLTQREPTEDKLSEIESRRQQELNQVVDAKTGKKKGDIKRFADEINERYDAEISALTTEQQTIPIDETTTEQESTEGTQPTQAGETTEAVAGVGETIPPTEPPQTPPEEPITPPSDEEFENKPKAILNRIYNSTKVSESFKERFKNDPKELRYDPQSHEVARQLAQEVINEFGVADSVAMAESGRFGGDVNSLIFAEAIDRTYLAEQNATTQDEKIKLAEQWADYAMRYDEAARQKGRFISAIYDFYRKSPLGVIFSEKAKRDEAFKDWLKDKEKGWKELYDAIKEDEDFKEFIDQQVKEKLKEERAESRKKRRKDINDLFDKGKLKGDQLSSSIIPPQIWNAAVEVMKQAALAGESVLSIIEQGVDYIKKNYTDAWDEKAFRDEWGDRLKGMDARGKQPLTSEEKRQKLLDKFRKKLSGLSDEQKEDVIRKAFKQLVENGALEYDDFKKIIADVMGLGELSAAEVTMINGFIKDMNAVQDEVDSVMGQTTQEGIKEGLKRLDKTIKTAESSSTKLHALLYQKADVGQRIRSIIQLNTLGIGSLVKNIGYNVFHQFLVRIPKAVLGTVLDQSIYGISMLANKIWGSKIIRPDVNMFLAQQGYFSQGSKGAGQALKQTLTGLTNKDYFQKEVYQSQIKPWTSIKDLWNWGRGKKNLTTGQIADKAIQATVGIPAEMVARGLNIGDKPFRFAAEGAAATTIGRQEFKLKGIELERFIRLPKEVAKLEYKKRGISEEDAIKKAEQIEQRIVTAGEEAVFQQNNVIAETIAKVKQNLQPKEGVHPMTEVGSQFIKLAGVLNMPFVKTPVNIAWEFFNLMNPEFALLQSLAFGIRAAKNNSHADFIKSKKWLTHAGVGFSLLTFTGYLASIGALTGDDEDEQYKEKEAKGKSTYTKPHRMNISKVLRAFTGGDINDQDGDVMVDMNWFGATGSIMNYQANKYENLSEEERENMTYLTDILQRMNRGAQDGLVNSTFQGTISLMDAARTSNFNNYVPNILNVLTNFAEPATIAQISRATRPYEFQLKDDSLPERLQNDVRARFFGKVTPKVNIWGEQMPKDVSFGGVVLSMLGIGKYKKDTFAEPVFQDFKRTGDAGFFPSVPSKSFTFEGKDISLNTDQTLLYHTFVGQARKNLAAPFVNDMATIQIGGKPTKYSELNDDQKKELLKQIYDTGREIGQLQFIQSNPDILK